MTTGDGIGFSEFTFEAFEGDHAIELYGQYFREEKISLDEAEHRVGLILQVLLDGEATKTFGHRKG